MIIARRTVDITTGKFYCWYGEINENADFAIATKSLKKFEKTFIEIVDKANDPATSSD